MNRIKTWQYLLKDEPSILYQMLVYFVLFNNEKYKYTCTIFWFCIICFEAIETT